MNIDVDEYYRRYGPMVLRRCRRLLRDEDEAADAMQDTFVRLLRYQGRLQGRAPSSLLYTMATNVCLNRLRSAQREHSEASGDLIEQIAQIDDHADRVLDEHFVERVFGTQKQDTRSIAVYHYVDGMTLEQTARATGMSVSGVRKRLRRLRTAGLELQEQ